jgi:hypothetical protein
MFLDCWAEPGFHRFWRVWNPVYGYVLFRLYLYLGGPRRRVSLSLLVFALCGFVAHDLPVSLIVGRPLLVCTTAFFAWGILASAARFLDRPLAFASWPCGLHVVVNLVLVGGGLVAGAVVQAWLTT